MKIILVLFLFFLSIRVDAASDPRIQHFLEMPPSQVYLYLKDPEIYRISNQLIKAAINARRMDLIEVCFKAYDTRMLTQDAIAGIQDPEFKDQVVIAILKTDIPDAWPPEGPFRDGSRIMLVDYTTFFSDVLEKHFPEMPMDGRCIESRALRLELAKKLEEKVGNSDFKPGEIPASAREESTPVQQKSPPPDDDIPSRHAAPPVVKKFPWTAILATIGLVFAATAGWWWIRKRRAS